MFAQIEIKDPDLTWVKLAQANHQSAVRALYEKYFQPIYRYLFWQTGDEATAEDLTQETFLGMVRGLKNFRGHALFRNWLYQIAKNQVAKWIKHKVMMAESYWLDELSLSEPDAWIDPDLQLKNLTKIKKLLTKLSNQERLVLQHRFLRAASVTETAKKLGLTISNVKVITHRSLLKLKKFVTS